ncbi:MAG: hypothetical protein ABSE41_05545 [Bacteroidota bacterium]|jgi:hypothetical protein
MKIKPVKHYKDPGYPTRESMLSNPSYLSECVPTRWKGNQILVTMLAVYLLGPEHTDAQSANVAGERPAMVKGDRGSRESTPVQQDARRQELPSIAPIFVHGDGRGSTGCVVMNPPVFLSEAEARQIIEEELMKEHVVFDKKNVTLEDVAFQKDYGHFKGAAVPITLDGYSTKYNLAYEIVTADDYHKFGGEYEASSVQSYDLVKAAENLRNKMKEHGRMNVVVFYDPLQNSEPTENNNPTYEDMLRDHKLSEEDRGVAIENWRQAEKNGSIDLLKRQVSDFIEWIKKEGLFEQR